MSQNRQRRRTGANQKAQQFVILNEMKNLKILSRRFTPSYDQIPSTNSGQALRQAQDDGKIGLLGQNRGESRRAGRQFEKTKPIAGLRPEILNTKL
jgi:hypothetical protein